MDGNQVVVGAGWPLLATYFDGNLSLPRITARPISNSDNCPVEFFEQDLQMCSGVGIPRNFDWVALSIGILTSIVIIAVFICSYMKLKVLYFKRSKKTYSNIEIVDMGKKHPKFKDVEPGIDNDYE